MLRAFDRMSTDFLNLLQSPEKLDRKMPKSANFPKKFKFILHPISMQFFRSVHHNETLRKFAFLFLKMSLKKKLGPKFWNFAYLKNRICGVFASSTVDHGFEPHSGQTKYNKIGIWCLSAKNEAFQFWDHKLVASKLG